MINQGLININKRCMHGLPYLLCDGVVHTCGKTADRRSQFLANKQEHAVTGRSVCDGMNVRVYPHENNFRVDKHETPAIDRTAVDVDMTELQSRIGRQLLIPRSDGPHVRQHW